MDSFWEFNDQKTQKNYIRIECLVKALMQWTLTQVRSTKWSWVETIETPNFQLGIGQGPMFRPFPGGPHKSKPQGKVRMIFYFKWLKVSMWLPKGSFNWGMNFLKGSFNWRMNFWNGPFNWRMNFFEGGPSIEGWIFLKGVLQLRDELFEWVVQLMDEFFERVFQLKDELFVWRRSRSPSEHGQKPARIPAHVLTWIPARFPARIIGLVPSHFPARIPVLCPYPFSCPVLARNSCPH